MATNPMYSPWLEYAPTFKWGGRQWGEGDLAAFIKKLGGPKKYDKWARKHRIAAKSFDPTEGQVYSQVQPIITGIDAERKKRAEYYTRLMQNLGGFTAATQGMLGQIGPAIGDAYSGAANAIGAAGTGYGRELNQQMAGSAATANATQDVIGAPEGQRIQAGDAGGVLAGLAGWIPKDMLAAQGGAYAKAASTLPTQAGIEAQINMKSILDKAMEEEGDYSTSITELLQKVPGFRAEAKTAQQKTAIAKQEFQLKQLQAKRDWYLDQAKLAFLAGDAERKNQMLYLAQQEEQRAVWESQGRDATGAVAPGYHTEGGRVIENGWHLDKNGQPKQNKSPNVGGSSGGGGPAATYISKIDQSADNIQSDIAGMTKPAGDGTFELPRPGDKTQKTNKVTYAKAFSALLSSYQHLAKGNPKALAYLKQLIRGKLIAAGIKPGAA